MAELTPMKRQYYEIKQRNPDCLLFFRLGDFYEMFDDDARLAARELDLTLTTRDRNVEDPAERTPMCGVPYHSAEAYIGRLIAKGYKVAICEQMEDPALAKGLVDRDVIRIITPGTVTASSMLEENKSNYLCAVYLSGQSGGTAFCDLSTGEFCAANYPADAVSHILNELGRFAPREAVCADAAAEHDEIRTFLTKRLGSLVEAGLNTWRRPRACASSSACRARMRSASARRRRPCARPGRCWPTCMRRKSATSATSGGWSCWATTTTWSSTTPRAATSS